MKRLILALLTGAALATSSPAYAAVKTIVLVHGAFADGSGWKPVADILQSHGYSVRVVQEPETSFAADVAATRRVLDKAGPCVLVGHSYGGMIITEAGMHPDVKGLVYVAATQPDVGESLSDLAGKMPAAAKSIGPAGDGSCEGFSDACMTAVATYSNKQASEKRQGTKSREVGHPRLQQRLWGFSCADGGAVRGQGCVRGDLGVMGVGSKGSAPRRKAKRLADVWVETSDRVGGSVAGE